jgi:hypothetical protein
MAEGYQSYRLNIGGLDFMPYRNGTYIAFHAGGTTDPTKSDIKYYNILKGWAAHKHIEFTFVNSHDKTAAVRDSSSYSTLLRRLRERLNASKQFLLFVSEITKKDADCVPYEIEYGVDVCRLPIIAVYPGYDFILAPWDLSSLWPQALEERIRNSTARVIHIPFIRSAVVDALGQFDVFNTKYPSNGYGYYEREAYNSWGIYP